MTESKLPASMGKVTVTDKGVLALGQKKYTRQQKSNDMPSLRLVKLT